MLARQAHYDAHGGALVGGALVGGVRRKAKPKKKAAKPKAKPRSKAASVARMRKIMAGGPMGGMDGYGLGGILRDIPDPEYDFVAKQVRKQAAAVNANYGPPFDVLYEGGPEHRISKDELKDYLETLRTHSQTPGSLQAWRARNTAIGKRNAALRELARLLQEAKAP